MRKPVVYTDNILPYPVIHRGTTRYLKLFFFFAIGLFFIFSLPSFAAATDPKPTPAQWQQLKSDKAFTYKNDREKIDKPKEYKPGALQKFFKAFFEFIGSNTGNTLIWMLVIAGAGFLIYKVFFSKGSFLFTKNKKLGAGEDTGGKEEDIAGTNWEVLLQQATTNNDLRLAVRYSYMWLLQMLQQRELIQYRNDKTNFEYYAELSETQYKQHFKQLSRQYEYAWYGRFTLSPAVYNDYISLFMNVKKQLNA